MALKTNCTKNGKNYFRVTKVVGHNLDGTPIRKEFYGAGRNEAIQKANEYMEKLEKGLVNNFDKLILADVMKKWLFETKILSVKPASFTKYEGDYRKYILPSPIANCNLTKIKNINIQDFYNELFKNGKTTAKIKSINKLLHTFFEYSIEQGFVEKNPCSKIVIPKDTTIKQNDKIDCFSEQEIKDIQQAFKGHKYEALINTAIYTGMRGGELCALKWKNVDLENGIVHVDESVKTLSVFDMNGKKETKTLFLDPKSKTSIRDIYIPNILIEKLKSLPKENEFVFTNKGNLITYKSLYLAWKSTLEKNNIPHKKFHTLRHTYATTLLQNGVDIKTVQELLGHHDISITQVYLHSLKENKKNAISFFDN